MQIAGTGEAESTDAAIAGFQYEKGFGKIVVFQGGVIHNLKKIDAKLQVTYPNIDSEFYTFPNMSNR